MDPQDQTEPPVNRTAVGVTIHSGILDGLRIIDLFNRSRRANRPFLIALRSLLAVVVAVAAARSTAAEPLHAGYVGGDACAECHPGEVTDWKGSHHDLAMQEPTADTVLGNFANATFSSGGITTRFSRDGSRYRVRTDGPDGKLHDYVVRYTFGADPMQQYLLELEGGRLQALGIAWDTRPKAAGGQRWFHLQGDAPPRAGERLHWTSPDQNWNHMCADCHSTDLQKGYEAVGDRYATSYAQLDVGCEACHGPGAAHLAWARQPQRDGDPRLGIRFDERDGIRWGIALPSENEKDNKKPLRSAPRVSSKEIETCARCHSRRGQLTETYVHGAPFGDHYRLALIEPGLYYADGQILDEVYVHGSFLQSRMHAAGVTCSDCHEPHSLRLRAEGDATCTSCHPAAAFATREHHHHAPASEAARCVNCHMPATTYMQIDPRRDHSFRIPRPDLTATLGVPNVCNGCHQSRDADWAAKQVARWTGQTPNGYQQHAAAFQLASRGLPAARAALLAVASDSRQATIARASAVTDLGAWLDREVAESVADHLKASDPLLRRAAVGALSEAPPQIRAVLLSPRLRDPVRDVRQAAALALAALPNEARASVDADILGSVLEDYRATLLRDADRPEAQINLGLLLTYLGDAHGAEAAYRRALAIEPSSAQAVANLADLQRATGRDLEAGPMLEKFIARYPKEATAHHALGLWLVRQERMPGAIAALRRAAALAPEDTHFGYVLAVGLHAGNELDTALAELDRVLEQRPYDRESLVAAVVWRQENGLDPAVYATRLIELQNLSRSGR